jgi:hypothetical protein
MLGLFGPIDLIIWYKLPVALTVNNVMIYAGLKVAYATYTYVYNPIPLSIYSMLPSIPNILGGNASVPNACQ